MLNNMKYWLENFLFTSTALPYTTSSDESNFSTPMIDTNGEEQAAFRAKYSLRCSVLGITNDNFSSDYGVHIYLGTGSTVPTTEETYCLENDVTMSFGRASVTSSTSHTENGISLALTGVYTNNTEKPITVNEAGLVMNFFGSKSYKVLLDRKSVADGNFEPITLGAGESKIFVYTLEL